MAKRAYMVQIMIFWAGVCCVSWGSVISRAAVTGIRVDLRHVDSRGNFSKLELVQRAARRSHHRVSHLIAVTSKASDAAGTSVKAQAPVHSGSGEFIVDMAIGTPSSPFPAILDTGSDLIWTQCKPCNSCFPQSTPIFNPAKSSSFSNLPCSSSLCQALPKFQCQAAAGCEYLYTYGDSSSSRGTLATETFSLGSTEVSAVAFGCGKANQGGGFSQGAGVVGLGRGPLSLISQVGLGKFSYCLTSLGSTKNSQLYFGSIVDFGGGNSSTAAAATTPFHKNPNQPSFYYLTLKDITVGGTALNIPNSTFAVQQDGTGGLIIDSGTSVTYLESAAYKILRKEFASQMNLPIAGETGTGLDLCFSAPSDTTSIAVPKLVFNFAGADLDLPPENYMAVDGSSGLLCLMVMESKGLSILGNFQQQNFQIIYDLAAEKLAFLPLQCDQL